MTVDKQTQLLLEAYLQQSLEFGKALQSAQVPRVEIPDILKRASQWVDQVAALTDAFSESIVAVREQYRETFKALPPKAKKALLLLAKHGWYLDPAMPLGGVFDLEEALFEGNVAEANEALNGYFEGRLDEIEKAIGTRFPERSQLVGAAFGAHRRGEYVLSIPVLLAQTDGICREVTGRYLFQKHKKRPGTAAYVDAVAEDCLRAAVLSPLADTLPISASEQERQADSDALSRHEVLHGQSFDYGTRTNGFKAISLLNYVAMILGREAGEDS